MIISRWQAKIPPSPEQIEKILLNEGLEPIQDSITKGQRALEKKHPFTEVRYIISGEVLFNVSGTQLLLRAGDRIEIPANTRHYYSAQSPEALTIFSLRPT